MRYYQLYHMHHFKHKPNVDIVHYEIHYHKVSRIMCNVYIDVGGLKKLYHGLSARPSDMRTTYGTTITVYLICSSK